jgi:outer membrane protein OmpA-like peptidoglycan-associated protein
MRPVLNPSLLLGGLLLGLTSCAAVTGGGSTPYVVFFTERSAALEPTAKQVIAQAATAAKAASGQVRVLGYTDSVGSAADDVALSSRRAKRVSDELVADGVPAERIVQQGRGQTGSDPGVESRRVDIILAN